MKSLQKRLSLCCLCLVLAALPSAGAAKGPQYTLPTKGTTVLQDAPPRDITPQTPPLRHALIPGESPTTGLPWEGEYLPMLVHIDNGIGKAQVRGNIAQLAGVGSASPWGVHYADIIYEGAVGTGGYTRFAFLFSDSFAQGEPAQGVGPVRSTRVAQQVLGAEWQCSLVHSGFYRGSPEWQEHPLAKGLRKAEENGQWVTFDVLRGSGLLRDYKYRVQGVKAPSNLNVDIIGLRDLIPAAFSSTPRPFLFGDQSPYTGGYASARTLHLDWGGKYTTSHFQYDEQAGAYLRYCGPKLNPARWAPFSSFATTEDHSEENRQPLRFANVIVQRVPYHADRKSFLIPLAVGQGNADIFIGGRYIPGCWVRPSLEGPTLFYDDQGREVQLLRGKTYIAQFPPEALCSYEAGEGS